MFTHLHVHSHYSLLDGMSKVPDLIAKCRKLGMNALALTDHGNMYGIKDLVDSIGKDAKKHKEAVAQVQAECDDETLPAEKREAAAKKLEALRAQPDKIKPIIGIEAYCARRTLYDKDSTVRELNVETGRDRIVDSSGWHLILLAKNMQGYHSLCKLSSIAFTEGFYTRPRIDHNILEQYHEGLIVCSACIGGEVPQKLLAGDEAGAEESILWFKRVFGDDYYIEIQRHKTDRPGGNTKTFELQERVNPLLIKLARKHNIKLVATNDVHFVEESHGEAHDHLICISTNDNVADPNRMHYTKQEWFKSEAEMASIFPDVPEALENTQEVADKVEFYSIDSPPLMPAFPIPESFGTEEEYRQKFTHQQLFDEFTRNEKGEVVLSEEKAQEKIEKMGGYDKLYRIKFEYDYLAKLTYEGAHKRYGDTLTDEQKERINFELHTIKSMGFPGYFLIVQDYIRAAREELGVSVGPGRGSAAGSVVAYCLWITDIDPLKYDLLFERFLNPDRISLPDIDVDFDDAGRGRVLDWVTQKYGKERVAHIITYGTMATKSSIADVGRVEQIPLSEVNRLKGYIPEKGFPENIKDEKGKSPKVNLANCYKYVPELKQIFQSTTPADVQLQNALTYAQELEDTNRQIGIHACGVIIGGQDLTDVAPVCTVTDKDTKQDVVVTQYDGHVIESVGLIKMDFLGLKTLTIIKDAIANVKQHRGEDVDIDHIPIDDPLTYDLYCQGATVGTFQFESPGMQKYLRELHPTVFEDLIAMNALYRPGPMDYIPQFIDCKLGRKPITYDIPEMERYLKDTYGVTVYQEQVMLLSRQLANFTRGQSDGLRKAMGKKLIDKMAELKGKFLDGGTKNGHPVKTLEKIWADWEKFASYAFNKSHATCYSWVAYQTAYLKAHYPAEYMAAVMTSSQADIKRVSVLMEECKRMGIKILAPSVNESQLNFSVSASGDILFGLQAISGMGEAAALSIIAEREKGGAFTDIFDFLSRIDLRTVNRKNLEVLIKAGAFDGLGTMHRAQYFCRPGNVEGTPTFIETLVRWAARSQESANSAQMSIFDMSEDVKVDDHPPIPECEEWTTIERCRFEKEVLGLYISGHPLDDYRYEMRYTNVTTTELDNLTPLVGKELRFAGAVVEAKTGISSRNNDPFGVLTIEDYQGSYEIRLFKDRFLKFKSYFEKGIFIFCKATASQWSHVNPDGSVSTSQPRLEISDISLLGDVLNRQVRTINMSVQLPEVNKEFCDKFAALVKENAGSALLEVTIVDNEQNLTLLMRNHSYKVSPHDIIPCLEQLPGVFNIRFS